MKVLFLHHNQPDYLSESLFHGLRSLLGEHCVDVPRYDSMYAPLTPEMRAKLRGNGFTLYGLLDDLPKLAAERFFWRNSIADYDLIVLAAVWWQSDLVFELARQVDSRKLVLLDGDDFPAFYPYSSLGWRVRHCPWTYFTPTDRFQYFKRELIGEGACYALDRFLPRLLRCWVPLPQNAQPISFSIPAEKLCSEAECFDLPRDRQFPRHIVDPEVAAAYADKSTQYAFTREADYYQDLKQAKFGITTKRAGWDCLRHYELAANGCVLCFRNLDQKPTSCAPHGLNDSNCIVYRNLSELQAKLGQLTPEQYRSLQVNTRRWIEAQTTIARAKQFLEVCLSE